MTNKIVVLSTCSDEKEGEKLARALLDERLAACVSLVPRIRSFYHWKGAIENAGECLLLIKTSREVFEPLCVALQKLHTYDVPEILAVPVVDGEPNYLNWLESNIRGGAEPASE